MSNTSHMQSTSIRASIHIAVSLYEPLVRPRPLPSFSGLMLTFSNVTTRTQLCPLLGPSTSSSSDAAAAAFSTCLSLFLPVKSSRFHLTLLSSLHITSYHIYHSCCPASPSRIYYLYPKLQLRYHFSTSKDAHNFFSQFVI